MQLFKFLDKVEYDSLKILLKHNEALINNDPFASTNTAKAKPLKSEPKLNTDNKKRTTTNIQKILKDVPKDPRQDQKPDPNPPQKADQIKIEALTNTSRVDNKSLSIKEIGSQKDINNGEDTSGSFLHVNPFVMRKIEELEVKLKQLNKNILKTNERFDIYYPTHHRAKNLDNSQNNISADEKSADMNLKHEYSQMSPFKGTEFLNQNISPRKASLDNSYNADGENKSFLFNDSDPRGVKLKLMFGNIQKQIDDMKSKVDFISMSASNSKSPVDELKLKVSMLEHKIINVLEGEINLDSSPHKEEQKEKAANDRKKFREKLNEEISKIK